MGNIDYGFTTDIISVNDVNLITSGIIDPTIGVGFEAPQGSLYLRYSASTAGAVYVKFGPNNIDWIQLGASNNDQFIRISATDNYSNYLQTKLLAGTGITLVNSYDLGSETLTINVATPKLYHEFINNPTASTPLAINSLTLGAGAQTDTTAVNAIAIGNQSLARLPGGVVQASGRFGSTGDAQTGKYLLRTHTVNSLETEMFIDGTGGSDRLVLPDDSTWSFKGIVTGHKTNASDGHAGFSFEGVIYRVAGASSVVLLGHTIINTIARSNTQWNIQIYADTTNGSLKITCKGQTGATIRWLSLVETVEITN
jgi:virulence-associated protein VapD